MAKKGPSTEKIVMYDGEVTLYYNDIRHRYEVDIPSKQILKKYVPGATSIKGKLDKSAALTRWAVNITLDTIAQYWRPGLKYHEGQINKVLRKAKATRYEQSAEAMDIGNMAHTFFEDYIKLKVQGIEPQIIEVNDPNENEEGFVVLPKTPEARNAIQAFLDWEATHEIEYLWSERRLYSRKHHFAGTSDAALRIDGKLYLADFKTSKRIYKDYFLQLAAYAKALEEMGHEKFDGLWTLRVPKDGNAIQIMDNKNIEFFHFTTKRTYRMSLTIARLFKYFLGLRTAYEFDEEAKDLYGDVVK
jgi:hypothetical protein